MPSGPTFVTVHPTGTPRPNSSVVNTEPLERARAVTIFAPVTPSGLVVHRSAPRERDRRHGRVVHRPSCPAIDRWAVRGDTADACLGLANHRSIRCTPAAPSSASSHRRRSARSQRAVINVTAIDATAPGYLTRVPRRHPAAVRVDAQRDLARSAGEHDRRVSTTARGAAFFASAGMHVLVDVAGYFTGPFATATEPVRGNTGADGRRVGPVRVRLVAGRDPLERPDSRSLQGANIVHDLESCRRLIGVSCRGREGYAPTHRGQRGGRHNPERSTPW